MSSWDQANRRQKLGFGLENRKQISQIIKDYFHLPFFLLIILWFTQCTNANLLETFPWDLDIFSLHSITIFVRRLIKRKWTILAI